MYDWQERTAMLVGEEMLDHFRNSTVAVIGVGGTAIQRVINEYGTIFVAGFTATNKLYGLMEMAAAEMSGSVLRDFVTDLTDATRKSLEKLEGDLEGFTLKFDYRNADKPWGDSRDALERTVTKLRSWCIGEEPNPK